MVGPNPRGDYPRIDKTAFIDPSAVVIGKVKVGKDVYVAPGAVIRADEPASSITVGDSCNVQDRVIIHATEDSLVVIGKNTSLSHGCIVHGPCRIGKGCFIGFGSVVFKARLEDGVFVKYVAAVVGVTIPAWRIVPNAVAVDTPEKAMALDTVPEEWRAFSRNVLRANLELLKGYRAASVARRDGITSAGGQLRRGRMVPRP